MKSLNFIFATLALTLTTVSSAAIPETQLTERGNRGSAHLGGRTFDFCGVPGASCNEKTIELGGNNNAEGTFAPEQFTHAMGNLSYLFGWQMAGSAINNNDLDAACKDISSTGHHKWAGESLVPAYIQEPICNVSDMSLSPARALPYIVKYSTGLFITQLLHAFESNDTECYATICKILPLVKLDHFHISTDQITAAVCATADAALTPPPVEADQIETSSEIAYRNAISRLYGQIYASASINEGQLNVNCAHAPESGGSWNGVMLNGTLVQDTICSVTTPMTTTQGSDQIKKHSTQMFVSIMQSLATGNAGYCAWLCKTVNVAAMDLVGMDGEAAKAQLCADVSA